MQYIVIGHDGKDPAALERRLAARPAHLALGDKLRDEGKHLYGVALLDEQEKMIGSILVVEFESRAALQEWLDIEPYVTGDVWRRIEVKPCRVGPSFIRK